MSGFHHDELADVNLITDNLRDRYKDQLSILKELVQNADDAHSKTLRFGFVNGDSGYAHRYFPGRGWSSSTTARSANWTVAQFAASASTVRRATQGPLASTGWG
jgi:hypothetical protein